MFDEFLAERARAAGQPWRPFDDADYQRYVDGRIRADGTRSFLASRGISLPEGEPDDPVSADTVNGLGNRKNSMVLDEIDRHGVETFPDGVRLLQAAHAAGLGCAVVSASANTQRVLETTGLAPYVDARIDGVVAERRHLARQARTRHVPRRCSRAGHRSAALRCVRRRRRRCRCRTCGRVRSGGRHRSCRRRTRRRSPSCRRRRGGDRSRTAPGRDRVTAEPAFAVDPWTVTETALDLEHLARTESVFALSNGHVGLRGNLEEGEALRHPRHLPELGVRAPSAAARRDRLRLPRVGSDHDRRDQREDHPPSGRRRAVRRPLRRPAPAPAHPGPARGHPRTARCEWRSPAGRAHRVHDDDPVGLLHPPLGRGDLLRGGADRRRGPPRAAIRTRGQRTGHRGTEASARSAGSCGRAPTTRAPGRPWRPPSSPSSTTSGGCACCCCTAPSAAGCASPPPPTTGSRPRTTPSCSPTRSPVRATGAG